MENAEVVVKYPQAKEDEVETKTITRTINYLEKGTNKVLKDPAVQSVTLSRTKTTNKVTGEVTYGEWSKGSWSEVIPESIANYKVPSVTRVEATEVTSTTDDKTIDVYYEADTKPAPKPAPKPELKPEPAPVPSTPETPEQPVAPVQPEQPTTPTQPAVPTPVETSVPTDSATQPATPKYVEGQKELPNTGTEANASLAALGLLGALGGFGLLARKKKED